MNGLYKAAYHKFWFDEAWLFVTKQILFKRVAAPIAWFDRHVVDGFMNALSGGTNYVSRKIKYVQTGEVQDYAWAFFAGTLIIVLMVVFL